MVAELPTEKTYVAVLETNGFTVGEANDPTGLFISDGHDWVHKGWKNSRIFGIALSPFDPNRIMLAAGNGVMNSNDDGESWRITTSWNVTEVLDVAFDPRVEGRLVCATAYGILSSEDDGGTWQRRSDGLDSTFVSYLSTSQDGSTLFASTESGVYTTSFDELIWQPDGLNGFAIRQISTAPDGTQAAATRHRGAWVRSIGGPWTQIRDVPPDATCYAAAINPNDTSEIVIGGHFKGLHVSSDRGLSSRLDVFGGPESPILSAKFEEGGGVLVGTAYEGAFQFGDGKWSDRGLPLSKIRRIV